MKVMMMISTFWIIFYPTITLFSCLPTVTSQLPYDAYPTANLSTLWINNDSGYPADLVCTDNSKFRIILHSGITSGLAYASGFHSNGTSDSYLFATFIVDTYDGNVYCDDIVWSANRNNPVGINSTLELTAEGDLVLKDGDGTVAWSTNTAGRSVARLNLTEMGNLVLLDANDSAVWQSFDRICGMALIQSYHQQGRLNFTVTSQAQVCSFKDNSKVGIILHGGTTNGAAYACGFYSNSTRDSYLFAIFIILISNGYIQYDIAPRVVWSANRNNPVGINSTLELTAEGDLVLKDGDGTLAWSTYTAGRSVARLDFTDMGNLVLLDSNDSPVWQSFDHPTYCWLPGQTLKPGMVLTAGLYSVSIEGGELVASIHSDSDHRQVHYIAVTELNNQKSYDLIYTNIHEAIYYNTSSTLHQYIKLGTDGHLRVFELNSSTPESSSWHEVADVFTDLGLSECGYPLFCGPYGICKDGKCSCPNGTSFRPINDRLPNLGCSEVVPLTCNASDNHYLLDLDNVTYFGFKADIVETDMNRCKEACLKNCSCKAAIFNSSSCYMPSQIFSLSEKDSVKSPRHSGSISIKIQNAPTIRSLGVRPNRRNNLDQLGLILGSSFGVLFVAVVVGVFVCRRRRRRFEEVEEDYLDHVPGMPTRFSFQELAIATDNFNKKLGEGGFGSVFEGSFSDGTRIAVKCLDGVAHIKKSFLAEVQSIGSIHHINLVRLIGFCAEKSHRLLVYAYMCNGSLEKWIYCKSHDKMLEWKCRRNIILDIAKGLAYLHEDCLQKIIHLDIKPQNILLDDGFNAKLGDFGLSKLIDRGQSNVVTTMRGTPGYLAPEWLKAAITEKVDVYSFGVVILEIVCGRKIFELSRPEEERHLPTLFMIRAEEGQWLDLVDKCCLDVESNVAEVEEMMQIAAWCLQSEPEKRPPTSTVIKILEGVKNVNVPKDMNYNFLISQLISKDTSRLLPSLLSGPR